MTTWVLIAFFGYRTAGITAEFTTKERCEAAAAIVLKNVKYNDDSKFAFCTEK